MYRFTATQLPATTASALPRRANRTATRVGQIQTSAETLWQLEAGGQAAVLRCGEDSSGCTRVVSTPDLLHYMKGWLVDDVARYARQWGWRLAFVA